VTFDAPQASLPVPDVTRAVHLAEAVRAPGLQVDISGVGGGERAAALGRHQRRRRGHSRAVVLFIAFGSLLAMLLPLVIAIAVLVPGLMKAGLLSHAVSIPSAGPTPGILIGLGVGIDYAQEDPPLPATKSAAFPAPRAPRDHVRAGAVSGLPGTTRRPT
jgi:RND superfamily putative drug exporter